MNRQLRELMKTKAEGVQAIVSYIRNTDEALFYSVDLTHKQGGTTIAAPGLSAKERETLGSLCRAQGLRLTDAPLRESMNQIHTALTFADWGIAETGSLMMNSSSEDIRIATMLAETHIAVLPVSKIRPTAESLESELGDILRQASPSYTAFITGASRTADIERVLAIGVHGPKELHLLMMEDTAHD